MRHITPSNPKLVDATLLMIFLGLMRHRKATRVADEMGMTQPAVSHALKRLRVLYRDPLFLRKAHGFEPTAVARELEPKVRRILRLINESLHDPPAFDRDSGEVVLRVAGFDYELATILPQLVADIGDSKGFVQIVGLPSSGAEALHGLVNGNVDLALGFYELPPGNAASASFVSETLYAERYVIAARRGHRLFRGVPSLEDFAQEKHLLVSPGGMVKGMVDHLLQARGLQRHVVATVPSLYPALAILEQSDIVAFLPSRIADMNARRFNLQTAPLPIEGGAFPISAVRHARDAQSRVHGWLVEQIRERLADGEAAPVRAAPATD